MQNKNKQEKNRKTNLLESFNAKFGIVFFIQADQCPDEIKKLIIFKLLLEMLVLIRSLPFFLFAFPICYYELKI